MIYTVMFYLKRKYLNTFAGPDLYYINFQRYTVSPLHCKVDYWFFWARRHV